MDNIAEKKGLEVEVEDLRSSTQPLWSKRLPRRCQRAVSNTPEICQALYKGMKSRFLGIVMNQIRTMQILMLALQCRICRDYFGLIPTTLVD